jgi:hypothetical protein
MSFSVHDKLFIWSWNKKGRKKQLESTQIFMQWVVPYLFWSVSANSSVVLLTRISVT